MNDDYKFWGNIECPCSATATMYTRDGLFGIYCPFCGNKIGMMTEGITYDVLQKYCGDPFGKLKEVWFAQNG